MDKFYDIAIIGAGPAGLTAAVYAGRYKQKTIVFGTVFGGTISQAHSICNFPGVCEISGTDLSMRMVEQVETIGVKIIPEKVEEIIPDSKKGFVLKGNDWSIHAKKVILATGSKRKKLGLKKESEFSGRGVSYCSTCDGPLFKDKIVGVVGGSDAALSSAVFMADVAEKVFLIHRRDAFRAEPTWVELVKKNPKIELVLNANVAELIGKKNLEEVKLDNGRTLGVEGLFIEIGAEPEREFLEKMGLKLDAKGYVIADNKMRTNVKGIFTAGDINSANFKQAVVAAAEGAIAANTAYEEIEEESLAH